MSNAIAAAAGVAIIALVALALVFFAGPPPPAIPTPALPVSSGTKADRLALAPPLVRRLLDEGPAPEPTEELWKSKPPELITLETPREASARVADPPAAKHHADLCERHGLRKVVTNGGRSWRCRR